MAPVLAAASLVLALGLCLQTASALPPPTGIAATTFTSIAPNKINVNITSFTVDNKTVAAGTPCTDMTPGNACLVQVQAARDQVHIEYSVKSGFPANSTPDYITLKACYSNYSSVDRPWRAFNNIISLSKRCGFVIATNLDPAGGNATWKIPNTVPFATYTLRALVYSNVTQDGKVVPDPIATGVSVGYFQVNKIDDRPQNMKVAAGICACVGPLMFASYFIVDAMIKKNK
jgi:hypothetical protein